MKRLPIALILPSRPPVDCGHEIRAHVQHRFPRHRPGPDDRGGPARGTVRLRVLLHPRAHRAVPGRERRAGHLPGGHADRRSARVPGLRRGGHRAHPARYRRPAPALPSAGRPGQAAGHAGRAVQGADAPAHRGVGALPGEAMAGGVDFATRGRRADEAIDVLRLLWDGDENGVSFDGTFFTFTGLCSFPKPLGRLPIHVGGSSPAAARRAGLRGDGYFPGGGLTEAERAAQVDLIRETARAAGRDPAALEYTRWGTIDLTADDVAAHAAGGTTRLVAGPASTHLS